MSEDAKWGFLKNIINIDRFFAGEGQGADSAEKPDKAETKAKTTEKATAKAAPAASAAETVKNAPPVYDESGDITTKAFSSSSGEIQGPNSLAAKPVKKQVCKTVIVDDGLPDEDDKSEDAQQAKAKLIKEVTNDDEKEGGYRDEDGKPIDIKKLNKQANKLKEKLGVPVKKNKKVVGKSGDPEDDGEESDDEDDKKDAKKDTKKVGKKDADDDEDEADDKTSEKDEKDVADGSEPTKGGKKAAGKKTDIKEAKKAAKKVPEKKVVLIEDRKKPRKKATKKVATKKAKKKVVKKKK